MSQVPKKIDAGIVEALGKTTVNEFVKMAAAGLNSNKRQAAESRQDMSDSLDAILHELLKLRARVDAQTETINSLTNFFVEQNLVGMRIALLKIQGKLGISQE